ncbi:hypothetical protein [Azorhizobium sp. AG788]|uniref:hypothetical protein n=1 Tax=Azorhizobium sp. AG788 TaxID=2183897 RepID=UPI00313A0BA4
MTMAKQVQTLMKPLVERHPDLAVVGRYVFLQPIHHFARGVYVGRCLDKDALSPEWRFSMLFYPGPGLGSAWSGYIYGRQSGVWKINDPNTQQELIGQIEDIALPTLRANSTMEDLAAFASDERFPGRSWTSWSLIRLVFQSALGDLQAARATCTTLSEPRRIPRDTASRDIHLTIVQGLAPLLDSSDRAAIGSLLRTWELNRLKFHKMDKYWQPAPFPVEREAPTGTPPPAP